MPRGKNYVNNNRGVFLQAGKKAKQVMRLCEYGSACNRPDCIYRHDNVESKTDEVCLQFLAGNCAFTGGGCRKRHPNKDEKERLLRKYKRTRCHFGDECHTEGCLYLHPREMRPVEPAYIEPVNMDAAFPALSATTPSTKKANTNAPKTEPLPPSPWNSGMPAQMQQQAAMNQQQNMAVAPAWFPQDPSFAPFCPPVQNQPSYYGGEGAAYGDAGHAYGDGYAYNGYADGGYAMGAPGMDMSAPQMPPQAFNAGAKEFIPGGFST